jgi:hypothetical protein
MARDLKLIRRVTATGGAWAGDASTWSQGTPPVVATVNALEVGSPIMPLVIGRVDAHHGSVINRGAAGLMRVIGADAARRFLVDYYVEMILKENGQPDVVEWNLLKGSSPVDTGTLEDFTTDPAWLQDAKIAFHLTPIGGSLAEDSVVEIWAADI